MPIELFCDCGKRLSVKDELVGKTIRCRKCGQKTKVQAQPANAPAPEEPPRYHTVRSPTAKTKHQTVETLLSPYQKAAKLSWIAPLAALVVGVFMQNNLRQDNLDPDMARIASISIGLACLVLGLVGLCAGIYGLFGGARNGSIRVLIPAFIGTLLSVAYLSLAVVGFAFVQEIARQRQSSIIRPEAIEIRMTGSSGSCCEQRCGDSTGRWLSTATV
jgi:ABC-type Fe3+-siderophore transport system permease subunit